MRDFVTLAAVMLSVFVGVPLLATAIAGLAGRLADVSHAENVQLGLRFLGAACAVLGPSILWFWLRWRRRWQFSLAALLWLVAMACVAFAAMAAIEGGLGAVVRGALVGWLASMIVGDFKRGATQGVVGVGVGAIAGAFGAGYKDDLLLGAIFGGLAAACAVRLVRSRLAGTRPTNEPASPPPSGRLQPHGRWPATLTPAVVSVAAGVAFGLVFGAIGYFTALPLDRWHSARTLFTLSAAVGGFVGVASLVAVFARATDAPPPGDACDQYGDGP